MKNKPINEMKLYISAVPENEALARACVSRFVSTADPTVSELADIRCAVSEAVTNCVVHAYRDKPGEIYINAKLYAGRKVTLTVADKGCGIADIGLAMTPLYTTDRENERSGMGFAIMQSFSDKMKVSSKPGAGTRVFMEKYLR
ncbi:MAG: anti-sigma F factor [Clostridia bacterium]|jgi:stage II sporulation protein AB (anti-sigma F factor)|nr:anti-sigma F factor [Clostridia bacterium]